MSVPVNPGWPQDYTGEEEGGGSASREMGVGGWGVPDCDAALETCHQGSQGGTE